MNPVGVSVESSKEDWSEIPRFESDVVLNGGATTDGLRSRCRKSERRQWFRSVVEGERKN